MLGFMHQFHMALNKGIIFGIHIIDGDIQNEIQL